MVRRAAAQKLGAFAKVVEREAAAKELLPLFTALTRDGESFFVVGGVVVIVGRPPRPRLLLLLLFFSSHAQNGLAVSLSLSLSLTH
jgi:hypothetical protein